MLRGRISARRAALEALRRLQLARAQRRERGTLDQLSSQPAQLLPEFQNLSVADLLRHFSERTTPAFLRGFQTVDKTAALQRTLFPVETERLVKSAQLIAGEHRWPLLGFGEMNFGEVIDWHRDPLSGRVWPLDFHADIVLWHNDGSDIRILWELNRLGHFLTLGRAYALTQQEQFAEEFFEQLAGWRKQNPVGRGANWSCAMEVALRAMNLLAAFTLFWRSPQFTAERLKMLLTILDQHGAHIQRNLEFSYLATSNHYLSDIAGLLWLGIMVPELSSAKRWREWAMAEILREMDKQILPDGADHEGATGYHRFVSELFLYSFVLCQANGISIAERHWQKLRTMLGYLRAILRPDGFAPLIGDTDGGQVLPIVRRHADDHAYLLALSAVVFHDSNLKLPDLPAPQELLWTLGEEGIREYEKLPLATEKITSQTFPNAGTHVLRSDDLFLLLNTSPVEKRPSSHRHDDALSIEVSACGCAFIVDPGAYVYTADLRQRHLFRSTAYHSTIQIDDAEQNTTDERAPFLIGDEARPQVLDWQTSVDRDYVVAEHAGYQRLDQPVRHRRTITFDKSKRWWLIEDELFGKGEHKIAVRFHFDAGLEVEARSESIAVAYDKMSGARLFVCALDLQHQLRFESQFSSKDYGSKSPSVTACWSTITSVPVKLRWAIVPVCAGEDEQERLKIVPSLKPN